ncbi:beta strand repeat-containing protein [Deinococcus sonorensis]|uniref:DUF11 domain-containing protein n=2 Tax=Deinococcus sonorensis TaxID=309891 RepID=A0AAU7UCN7_9DEIO
MHRVQRLKNSSVASLWAVAGGTAVRRLVWALLVWICGLQALAAAAPVLSITPISWNVIGLDSNNPTAGPDTFPVGARVCNVGDTTATGLSASFVFDGTRNTYLNTQGLTTVTLNDLPSGSAPTDFNTINKVPANCQDAYFNIVVTRTSAAYNTTQNFHITASATGLTAVSTPTPRQLFVEKLVSQNRNAVISFTGSSTVSVGQVVQFTLNAKTATGGYEQLENFPVLPNSVYQILNVATSYNSPTGAINSSVYGDACGWDNVITNASYRSCIGPTHYSGGKVGDNMSSVYTVRVISGGAAGVFNLIYDFSGSSYHYNSDYGTSTNGFQVTATAPDVTLTKTHTGNFTVGQPASFTFTVGVTGAGLYGTTTVTDTLPAGLSLPNGPVTLSGANAASWACTSASNVVTCKSTNVDTPNAVNTPLIAAGGSSVFSITGITVLPTAAASVQNTATVSNPNEASTTTANNSSTDTVTVLAPDVTLTKTHTGNFTVSQPASFTFTVGVTGAGLYGTTTISDTLPAGLTLPNGPVTLNGTNAANWQCSSLTNVVTCTSTNAAATALIAAGGSSSFTITGLAVGAAAVPNVSNTATVSNPNERSTATSNNSSTDAATVSYAPLVISKTFSPTTIVAGNTTTLSVTVTNPNPVAVSALSITDNVATTMGYLTPMLLRVTANTCGGTTSAAQNATGVLTLTTGTVPAQSSCQLTVAFTPSNPTVGTATNTIPAANVTGTVNAVTVTAGAAASATLTVTAGSAGGIYVCDPNFYQIREDPTTLLSTMYMLDLNNLGSGGVAQWSQGFGPALNALAYNPKDSYFYAVNITAMNSGSPFRLYRLGRTGAVEYASLTNIPTGSSVAAAAIDRNGVMYIKKLQQDAVIYRYDLVANAPLSNLNLVNTLNQSASVTLWDLAVNPLDNQIYGAMTPGAVSIINPTTGVIVTRGTGAALAANNTNAVGTLFFNFSGVLYAYQNGGAFGTIDLTTGAFIQTATASSAVQSDGGSCAFATSATPNLTIALTGPTYAKPSTVASTNPPVAASTSTISYTLTVSVTNANTTGTTTVTDTLPSALSWTATGNYTSSSGSWTCGISAQVITCTTSSSIAAGTPQTLTLLNVRVAAGTAGAPSFTDTATVSNAGESSADATVGNSASAITKLILTTVSKEVRNVTADQRDNAGVARFGTTSTGLPTELLEYCIDTKNLGGADLPKYILTDVLDSNSQTLTSVTSDAAYSSKAIKWTRVTPGSPATTTTGSYTAAASDDNGTLDTSLTMNMGTLLAGETVRTCFQVRVR